MADGPWMYLDGDWKSFSVTTFFVLGGHLARTVEVKVRLAKARREIDIGADLR